MTSANINLDFYGENEALRQEIGALDKSVDFNAESTDAIGILVELARQGKIDPWNIDIVDVYDKYTAHLAKLKAHNLKLAGRAILFISVLLKLKSNILKGLNVLDFDLMENEDDFYEDDFEGGFDGEQMKMPTNNIISFDEVLQRRTSTRLNRSRNVTLKDLIRHLEFYEELEKKRSLKNAIAKQKRRVRDFSKMTASDIKNLAHEEYIESIVEKMSQNLAKILEKETSIELRELCLLGFDRVSAYLAVLFLSARNKNYTFDQEEFYGKLHVRRTTEQEREELQLNAG
ncbi:MAG: hypothetical protein E7Z91_01175 [Cyanobacteria bacterium SIG30]|nr:hypothetical protein [Cyanobacteria bacterium SIG30]